jgi:dolichol-phosphate mannosyltransferase
VNVTVVIPTYNEAENIEGVIRAVKKALPDGHILVVDDASPDGTAEIAARLGDEFAGIEVLHRSSKEGLGAAYRSGLQHAVDAGAAIVVQMDADMSHDPAALPALVSVVQFGVDAALGSRYVPGGRIVGWPWKRTWLSRWGNRYAAAMLGLAVNDATCGYRAYSADALRLIGLDKVRADGYGFQIEMTHRLVRQGGSVAEIPVTFVDRTVGHSKMSGPIVREALVLVAKLAVHDALRGSRWRRSD